MKRLIVSAAFLALSSLSYSAPELKGSPQDLQGFLYPKDNIISISDFAEEKAYSDKAEVNLVISTENKLLSEAIKSNGALRNKISKVLVEAGIAPDLINSSKFSSSPQYGWFGNKPSSYKVVNRMAISIANESHLQDIAVVADEYEEVELSDTAFEHSKKEEYSEKVKAKALEKILKQKAFYEKSLGVKLTAIDIRDVNVEQDATRGARVLEEVVVVGMRTSGEKFSSVPKSKVGAHKVSFDEVKYEARLTVDFKIEH